MKRDLSNLTKEELISLWNQEHPLNNIFNQQIKNLETKLPGLKLYSQGIPDPNKPFINIITGHNLYGLTLLAPIEKYKLALFNLPFNNGKDCFYNGELVSNSDSEKDKKYESEVLPLLKQTRLALTNDGAIVVTADDSNLAVLDKMLKQVFGAQNKVAQFTKDTGSRPGKTANNFAPQHEYLIIYSKQPNFKLLGFRIQPEEYSNPDNDPRGNYRLSPMHAAKPGGDVFYPIIHPTTGKKYWPPKGRYWPYNQIKSAELLAANRLSFKGKQVFRKVFQSENPEEYKSIPSILTSDTITKSGNAQGSKDLSNLIGKNKFPNPKAVNYFAWIIEQILQGDKNAKVLDAYAGSGTTAHALMVYNEKYQAYCSATLMDCNSAYTKLMHKRLTLAGQERYNIQEWEVTLNKKLSTNSDNILAIFDNLYSWLKYSQSIKQISNTKELEVWQNNQGEITVLQKYAFLLKTPTLDRIDQLLVPVAIKDIEDSLQAEVVKSPGEEIIDAIQELILNQN